MLRRDPLTPEITIDTVRPWSPLHPHLYRADLVLRHNGEDIDGWADIDQEGDRAPVLAVAVMRKPGRHGAAVNLVEKVHLVQEPIALRQEPWRPRRQVASGRLRRQSHRPQARQEQNQGDGGAAPGRALS